MAKGCYPYSLSQPVYSHDRMVNGMPKPVYHQTEVALEDACINELVPDPTSPSGVRVGYYYTIDPKTGRPEINPRTGEPIPRAITYQECINKLLEEEFDIPADRTAIKEIQVDYIYPASSESVSSKFSVTGPSNKKYFAGCIDPFNFQEAEGFIRCIEVAQEIISSYLNIKFVQGYITNTTPKTIRIGLTKMPLIEEANGVCIGHSKNKKGKRDYGGDIWISHKYFTEAKNKNPLDPLGYEKAIIRTILHEIAHALGLSHSHQDELKRGKSGLGNKSQTWGDRTCCSIMSYGNPRYASLMKHDIDALQSKWGRRCEPATEMELTIKLNSLVRGGFLLNNQGGTVSTYSLGPKLYDNKNIKVLDCSTANTPLHIDEAGVFTRSDRSLNARYPKVVFSDHTNPSVIVDGRAADRIVLGSKTAGNIVLCRLGDDRIHGSKGDDTIIFDRYHGNVNIIDSQGFLKLVFPWAVNQLQFSRLDDHLLIYNPEPIEYSFPKRDYIIIQEEKFWVVKNKSNEVISRYSYQDYTNFQKEDKFIFKTTKPRLIKIINGFLRINQIAIYNGASLSAEHQQLLKEISKKNKYYLTQHFNPNTLRNPIYGYDQGSNTLILQGYWRHLALSLARYRDEKGVIVKKIPSFKIADRHVSQLEAGKQNYKSGNTITETLIIKAKTNSDHQVSYNSFLAIREFQHGNTPDIRDKDNHKLTLAWPQTRLPYRQ